METPEWFRDALATPCSTYEVESGGARIAVRAWGPEDAPGVVLVHGGAAHSRWWDHIAPMLGTEYRIIAVDLSGHGDSGRRPAYELSCWAREVVDAVEAARMAPRPVVVGHSMGGWVALTVGAEHDGTVAGVIVIDSPVRERSPEEVAAASRRAFGPLRTYADREGALARFHTVPEQEGNLPFVMRHVAACSLRDTGRGWTWKFDPAIFAQPRPRPEMLGRVVSRVALLRAERGLVTPEIGAQMYELLGRAAPVVELPLAGHHPMLDQPLSLITAIRTLLADWEHSAPRPRCV
ncbi:alpha/beta fold hydrolase [Amycolatopsis thermophila]|uniref:Pimeloyl-ACP methyl ester carboxylesterase n=1 Tax=Amycolatopsis thermophila TaxID=206084 RepID=A0ABU0F5P4_9PSEU|nr:alpha/beta hydrolase [Amycolatopsis thermophila]MDQ0382842.1 pimeloyl-ACP methyl ester carboxylesterase [Amycolatopsis thermophila]